MYSNGSQWAGHSQFSSFWTHYEAAEKWRKKHSEMVRDSYAISIGCTDQSNQSKDLPHGEWKKPLCTTAELDTEMYTEEPMEVDPDYVEFRRITLEHQSKQAALRANDDKEQKEHWITINNEDYVLADKIGVNGIQRQTLENPDEKSKILAKRKEAKEMYGQAAEKLLAMETALDVQFNEVMHQKQPPLWPNIPLRFY